MLYYRDVHVLTLYLVPVCFYNVSGNVDADVQKTTLKGLKTFFACHPEHGNLLPLSLPPSLLVTLVIKVTKKKGKNGKYIFPDTLWEPSWDEH